MKLEIISYTNNTTHKTPILFVHGAWHAAWCWENFLPYFAEYGYPTYALSLRGHGKSEGRDAIRWHSAAYDYVADIDQVFKTFQCPPVLVGHSMGGYVVQKYLETHAAPACALLAPIPVSGIAGFAVRFALQHPWKFLKSQLLLNPWHMIETVDLAKEAFFSKNLPKEEIMRHFQRLQTESFRMELDTLLLKLPRPEKVTTPILVLAAADDKVFTISEAQSTARAYQTEAEIFPNMAHDMMLEPNWQGVANRILLWLNELKL